MKRQKKLLGLTLQEADLISVSQLTTALKDQVLDKKLRLGEILALRGWLKQETADFFAEQWPLILEESHIKPLGYYLKEAALLDEPQIQEILEEQKTLCLKFGSVAILRGWLKRKTVQYFLENLLPDSQEKADILKTNIRKISDNFEHQFTAIHVGYEQITLPSNFQQIWTDKDLMKLKNLNYVIAKQ